MNLLIYLVCQEGHRQPMEQEVRIEWGEVPQLESQVSMGKEKRWQVVKTIDYSRVNHEVSPILVYIYPQGLEVPPFDIWDFVIPNETLHVELEAIGKPELQMGWNVLGQAPKIGTRLMDYESTDHPTLMHPVPTDWVIDRYDEFLPQTEAPYKAIYLSWCKHSPLAIAA